MRWIVQGTVAPLTQTAPANQSEAPTGSTPRFARKSGFPVRLAQGTVRTPTQSTVTPFVDKWGGSASGPRQRAVRAVGFLVGAIVVLHVPAVVPENVHPDKYHPPNSRVVRVQPRPFWSQSRTITFSELFPLDWSQDDSQVMRPKRPQRPDFFVVDLNALNQVETVGVDKFEPPNIRVVRTAPRPFFSQARTVTFTELFPLDWSQDDSQVMRPARPFWRDKSTIDPFILTGGENIRLDKWRGSLGRVVPPPKRLPTYPQSVVQTLSTGETLTFDKWVGSRRYAFRPAVHLRREHPAMLFTPEPAEDVTLDKWDFRDGKILRPPVLTKYPDPVLELGEFTETASVDKWRGSSLTRGRSPAPLRAYPGSALQVATFEETITPEKWRGSSLTRGRLAPPLRAYPGSVIQLFSFAETITLDKWTPSQLERSRPKKPLTFYPEPIVRIGTMLETIRPDKWLGSGVPPHRFRRAVRGRTTLIEILVETVYLDKYTGVLPRVPERVRLVRGITELAQDFFDEKITLDRWLESGRRPHLFLPVLRPYTLDYPYPVMGSPPEDVMLDKWLHDYRVTRPSPRLFVYPPPILVLTEEIAIVPGTPAEGLDLQVIKNLRKTSTTPDVIRYGSQTSGSQTKRDAIAVAMQNRFRRMV